MKAREGCTGSRLSVAEKNVETLTKEGVEKDVKIAKLQGDNVVLEDKLQVEKDRRKDAQADAGSNRVNLTTALTTIESSEETTKAAQKFLQGITFVS